MLNYAFRGSQEASAWLWGFCPGASSAVFWVDAWLSLPCAVRVLYSVGTAALITEDNSCQTYTLYFACSCTHKHTHMHSLSHMLIIQLLYCPVVSNLPYPQLCYMYLLLVLLLLVFFVLFCFVFSLFV